jgi:hypothetical protein
MPNGVTAVRLRVERLEERCLLSSTTFDGTRLTVTLDTTNELLNLRCAADIVDGVGTVPDYPNGVPCNDVDEISVAGEPGTT